MKSRTTQGFRELLNRLPAGVQESAERAYTFFRQNPHHPSLRFKKVHTAQEIYSVRVTEGIPCAWVATGRNHRLVLD
jgi:hypothetical protein